MLIIANLFINVYVYGYIHKKLHFEHSCTSVLKNLLEPETSSSGEFTCLGNYFEFEEIKNEYF